MREVISLRLAHVRRKKDEVRYEKNHEFLNRFSSVDMEPFFKIRNWSVRGHNRELNKRRDGKDVKEIHH